MFVPVKLRSLLKSYILSELADRNYMVGESCFRFESRIKERISIVYHLFKKNVKKLLNKEAFILAFLKKYLYLCNSGYHIFGPKQELVCSVAC